MNIKELCNLRLKLVYKTWGKYLLCLAILLSVLMNAQFKIDDGFKERSVIRSLEQNIGILNSSSNLENTKYNLPLKEFEETLTYSFVSVRSIFLNSDTTTQEAYTIYSNHLYLLNTYESTYPESTKLKFNLEAIQLEKERVEFLLEHDLDYIPQFNSQNFVHSFYSFTQILNNIVLLSILILIFNRFHSLDILTKNRNFNFTNHHVNIKAQYLATLLIDLILIILTLVIMMIGFMFNGIIWYGFSVWSEPVLVSGTYWPLYQVLFLNILLTIFKSLVLSLVVKGLMELYRKIRYSYT